MLPELPNEEPISHKTRVEPGSFDSRVFDQTEWWINRNGAPRKITEIDSGYRQNILGFLYENVERFYRMYAAQYRTRLIELEQPGNTIPLPSDKQEWLESTPLVQTLLTLEPAFGAELQQPTG